MARRYKSGNFQAMSLASIEKAVIAIREKGDQVLEAAKAAIKNGAIIVTEDIKSRCPVDTGKLKESIKNTSVAYGAAYEITATAENKKGVPYGRFVEFGVNGRPFFYPAMDAHRDEIKENVKNAMQKATKAGGLWIPAN